MEHPVFRSTSRVVVAGLALAVAFSAPLAAQTLVDPVFTTPESGQRLSEVRWLNVANTGQGIAGIGWAEKDNKPCYIAIKVKSLADGTESVGEHLNICGRNFNPPSFSDMVSGRGSGNRGVIFGGNPRHYLRKIQACTVGLVPGSPGENRLKGIRIWPASVSNASTNPHEVNELTSSETAEQPNCFGSFENEVSCPNDQIATALVVHHSREQISGLALRCKRVTW